MGSVRKKRFFFKWCFFSVIKNFFFTKYVFFFSFFFHEICFFSSEMHVFFQFTT